MKYLIINYVLLIFDIFILKLSYNELVFCMTIYFILSLIGLIYNEIL